MNICILVPVCSRNQSYSSIEEIPFFKNLYPSFERTKDSGYNYTFFVGYDDDDIFYNENADKFGQIKTFRLEGCQHAPAAAWNKLAKIAYDDPVNYDYFFQIGDDVTLETPGWTNKFINRLTSNNNLGVVGPCYMANYYGRVNNGTPYVIENAFVARKHLDIFGYFFHPKIKNWFCDDWMTRIYDDIFCEIQVDYTCQNTILGSRYNTINIKSEIQTYINEGKLILQNHKRVFSYCVYGTQKKYCLGMVKNLEQIEKLFPGYRVVIYVGDDVPQEYIDKYKSYHNVTLIHHDFTDIILTIYRYLVIDYNYDIVFVRDADSRFGDRDVWCINHFLNSDYKVFTIRDHPWHGRELMAGQTGFKNIKNISIKDKLDEFIKETPRINYYQNDQDFINKYIFSQYKGDTIAYSEFYSFGEKERVIIAVPRKSNEDFCGNVFLFDDNNSEDTEFTIYGKK
jgi:hypothetical protein